MADSTILPAPRAALVARDGTTSPEFYRFFRGLSVTAGLPARVDDLTVRVDALEEGGGSTGNVVGKQSIVSAGVLSGGLVTLRLDGDQDAAPALSFYGALAAGSKGWQVFSSSFAALDNGDGTSSLDLADIPNTGTGVLLATTFDVKGRVTGTRAATITGTAGRVTVANGDASAGLPTIDLATVADAGGGTLQRFVRDAWGRLSGTSAATTTDLTEGANLYYTDARADARIAVAKTDPNGIASLVGGKLDAGQLPALAITETFVVASQAAMLALTCQQGDVAARTDINQSFILTASPPSTLANWQELLAPTGTVSSFNGRTGSVVPASGDYTPAQVGAEPAITAGTATQYWRGDKSWRDFATDVRATVLTGLSTVTSAVITAADTVLAALGKLQAQISDNLLPVDFIDGLQRFWISGTSVGVRAGAAYIQGSGKVVRAAADLTLAGLALTPSAWSYLYVYNGGGVLALEASATAPAAPYSGSARSKAGDTTRRYVGSVLADASGNIYRFITQSNGAVMWEVNVNPAPFLVLAAGRATTPTNVSCSGGVPVACRVAVIIFATANATADSAIGNSDLAGTLSATNYMQYVGNGVQTTHFMPLDSSQRFSYVMTATTTTGGLFARIVGYFEDR